MSSVKSILVLGAGELGSAMLDSLAKHPAYGPTKVTVLLRQERMSTTDATKKAANAHLEGLGVHLLPGDVTRSSEKELADVFTPFETIISCTGMTAGPGTQLKLARAVLAARVKRYFPWQFGVDYDAIGRASAQDLFTEQLEVRDLLRSQSETSWVIISTGLFMTYLFEESFGVVSKDRSLVRALGEWENRVTVTAAEDIGRTTAEIALGEPDLNNQVVYVGGDTITYSELANVIEQQLGPVKRERWTLEHLDSDLKQDPENGTKKYRIVFANGIGVSWDLESTFNHKRRIKSQTVEQWLRNS